MQRKLKDLYSPAGMAQMQMQTGQRLQQAGMGGMMSQPSMDAYKKSTQQARRELDQIIAEQAKGQEKITKLVSQREQTLEKLRVKQKEMVKDSQEELKVRELISRVEENSFRKKENYKQRDQMLNQLMDARQNMRPQGVERLVQAYQGGGLGGMGRAGMRMFQGLGPAGMIGAAGSAFGALAGGVGAFGNVANDVYRGFGNAPINIASQMGSATRGTIGSEAGSALGGRSPFELIFANEKLKSSMAAQRSAIVNKRADIASLFLNPLQSMGEGVAAGAGGGATIGAGIGAMAGGVGAAPGAVAGGIIGGVGGGAFGLIKGIANLLTNQKQRSLMLSPFSKTASKEYETLNAQEFAENYQKALEGEKSQNPFKQLAAQDYEQNFMKNLQTQRALGLGFGGFHGAGGFRDQATAAGFTSDMSAGMSSDILGAGGSTRMARDSAFGLQLQRGANMTNAGQVLGTLSGGLGGSESTRQATIKILAEGTRVGLDDSKFAEENRKFTQMTAEYVAKSGSMRDSDIDRVIQKLGSAVVDKTSQGLEAAKGAYESFQGITGATSGPQGVRRAAGFFNEFKSTDQITRAQLAQIPEGQLSEDQPAVRAAALQEGISPREVIDKITGKINPSAYMVLGKSQQMRTDIMQKAKDAGIKDISRFEGPLPKDLDLEFQQYQAQLGLETGTTDVRKQKALAGLTLTEPGTEENRKALEDMQKAKIESKDTGKVEDTTIGALAESSKMATENFRKFKDQIVVTADAVASFNEKLKQTVEIAGKLPEDQRSTMLKQLFPSIFDTGSQSQTQSGKSGK